MVGDRDDFSAATIALAGRRAGYRCSRPDCRAATSGPAMAVDRAVNVGVAAHITAAARGGPRYDANLTSAERRDITNAIWLCETCGKLVDSDTGRYSREELREWKAAGEAAAERELGRAAGPGSGIAVLERRLTGHSNYIWDVVVTPDGRRTVSASNDRSAALWDLHTGQRLCRYGGAPSEVCSVAVASDGDQVIGGCLNGDVVVWRTDSPEPLRTFNHGALDVKVAWFADRIITGGGDGWLRIWSPGGLIDAEWHAHDAPVLKVATLLDGRIASTSEDGTVRVWRAESMRLCCEFQGHSGHVNSVAIANTANLAVTGSADCTVKVWDLESGALQHSLEGHCDPVWRVAIDANEQWVASGAGDNTVRLWDLAGGFPVDELRHPDCVAAVCFSPDGEYLVVGCDDTNLYVYRVRQPYP